MSRKGKVIVAMSGGVDSSVAACLLKQRGYECVGVFMRVGAEGAEGTKARRHEGTEKAEATKRRSDGATEGCNFAARVPSHLPTFPPSHPPEPPPRRLKHGCCSAADAADARAIASRLDIPFYVLNFEQDFERIIEYFVDEYARARTPNPCIVCNTDLKFGKLLRYADMLDAEFVATGHYARIVQHRGHARLARSHNRDKDQSYVLFGIRREDLSRCLFPVGEITDKTTVRQVAADLGLRVHDKPDSQEICFVPDDDYKRLVRQRRPQTQRPGEVRDTHGRLLGTHDGVANYTIGQRRGLGIAAGTPIYVTNLDARTNSVTVGSKADLLSRTLVAERINWLAEPPDAGGPLPATIKIRHTHRPAPGSIRVLPGGCVAATFDEPQSAVTPGQAAVFYDQEDFVIAGGWIRAARPPAE